MFHCFNPEETVVAEMKEDVPTMSPSGGYAQWKKAITFWKHATEVPDEKRGFKVALSLSGRAKEIAFKVPEAELAKETGLATLIAALDKVFLGSKVESVFVAVENLEEFKRDKDMSISTYIMEFIRLKDIVFSETEEREATQDSILAFRLLKQANLTQTEQQLVRATITALTFENMVETLKKIYGERFLPVGEASEASSSKAPAVKIKEEPTYYQYEPIYDEEEYQRCPEEEYEYDQPEEVLYTANGQPYRRTNYYANRGRGRPNFRGRGTPRYPPRNEGQGFEAPRDSNDKQRYTYNRRDPETGFITKCSTCKSVMHYYKECPHRNTSNPAITMFMKNHSVIEEIPDVIVKNNDKDIVYLMDQTLNKAILDTGATTTVCGDAWLKVYEESLTKDEAQKIEYLQEDKSFRFGDGNIVKSTEAVILSTEICGKPARIKSHIVNCKIPLLISRASMKRAKLIIDCENDEIRIGDSTQKLITTDNGHMTIEIGRSEDNMSTSCDDVAHQVMLTVDSPRKTATHLHRYFGHASGQKIGTVIRNSDIEQREDIQKELKKLDESCEFCIKHKRAAPHQKVGLPLGQGFNSVIAMDLKFIGDGIILHMIDVVTRFSSACIVEDKKAESIVHAIFVHWIAIFGRPDHYLTDNGGEFVNKELLSMCENLEIKILTTAAYAPWMNGIVERHNGVLGEMIEKIMEDTRVSLEISTCWAVNAKNSLCMVYGFSPYQLVMGRNPKIPNVLDSKTPTYLNESTCCKLVSDHLNSIYSARQEFTHAENSHRLKRALKEKIYPAANARFVNGDVVYFKREKIWKGPATVIGQDGKQVLMKNGGFVVKAHSSKVVLRNTATTQMDSKTTADVQNNEEVSGISRSDVTPSRRNVPKKVIEPQQWGMPEESSDEEEKNQGKIVPTLPTAVSEKEQLPPLEAEGDLVQIDEPEPEDTSTGNQIEDDKQTQNVVTPEMNTIPVNHPQQQEWNRVTVDKKGVIKLKKGDMIRFKETSDDSWKVAIVDSRAGKLKGVNQNSFNIIVDGDEDKCIPADKMASIERSNAAEAMMTKEIETFDHSPYQDYSDVILTNVCKRSDDLKIKEAQEKEMTKWKEFNVYTEVKDIGQQTISTRWVVEQKGDGLVKARLVARGFEEMLEDKKDAPTADKSSIRMFLTLSACNQWEIETIDIKSAFLQSHDLERDVFLKPPKIVRRPGVLWKIHKPIYGLDDAAKLWYNTVKEELISSGCKMLVLDHSVFAFYCENTQKLIGLLLVHVDDFLFGGTAKFKKAIIQKILDKYQISKQSSQSFVYLGWNVVQDEEGISMDQREYCKGILPVLPLPKKKDDELLSADEKKSYQGLLGKLNWLACQSRPDLKYDVLEHACYNQSPNVSNLKSLNKVTRRLIDGPQKIRFPKLDLVKSKLEIVVWTDASLGKLPNEGSGRGYIVFLKSGMKFSPLAWHSNKISKVCTSIFAAETLGFNDGVAEALLMRQTISELLYQTPRDDIIPIICIMDSKQLHQHLQSTSQTSDKRIRLEVALLREDINKNNVKGIFLVRSEYNLADCLTKKGQGASCDQMCRLLESGEMDQAYWEESLMSQIMTVEYWEDTNVLIELDESE